MTLPNVSSTSFIKTESGYENDIQSNVQAKGKGKAPKMLPIDPINVINGNPPNSTVSYIQRGVEPI